MSIDTKIRFLEADIIEVSQAMIKMQVLGCSDRLCKEKIGLNL